MFEEKEILPAFGITTQDAAQKIAILEDLERSEADYYYAQEGGYEEIIKRKSIS